MFLKIFLFLSVIISSVIAHDIEKKHYGYSYLAVGFKTTLYEQVFKSSSGDYKLTSNIVNPYYTTATLTRINEELGFEIYAASTLFAKSTTEDVSSINNTASHKLDFSTTDIALTLHYKPINENHRITLGSRYTYEVLKRYDFKEETLSKVALVENRIASISFDVGYMYVSKIETGIDGFHYRVGISAGIPFYAITADTYPPESFDMGTSWGYKIDSNVYVGYPIYKGIELGAYANAMYRVRYDKIRYEDVVGNTIDSKNSNMQTFGYGLMASWSL